MQKTKLFFIFSILILGVCTSVCAPNIVHSFSKNYEYHSVAQPSKMYPTQEKFTLKVNSDVTLTQKIKNKFSISGISKKLFTVLVFSLAIFFAVLSIVILKIRSILYTVSSNSEFQINEAFSQLNSLQNKIKKGIDIENSVIKTQKNTQNISEKLENVVSKPINKKYTQNEKKYVETLEEPVLISQKPLSKTKGFYLVDCGKEKALVGYIKDEIFVLNKFRENVNSNIHVRFTERIGNRLVYLVKNGNYKALVQVEKENMKVLLEM